MSTLKKYLLIALIFVSTSFTGCGIQDSSQPAENSISASPKTDMPVVKPKKAPSTGQSKKNQ